MLLQSAVLNVKKIFKKTFLVTLGLIITLGLISCGKESSPTDNCKLSLSYQNKDFVSNGIGAATLSKATDGDTATFRLTSGDSVTIRFYGIDTPESTGSVEKWGKSASVFTADKLKNAKEIVLEATSTPASKDSYGTRYLGYVWYRNSENEDFRNLNLEIVENGYSENKCINTSAYKYYSYFKEAENLAKGKSLHIWSEDDDPYFSTSALEISIKDFYDNPEQFYNEENESGAKIRFEGYVVGNDVAGSSSQTYTFTAAQEIDGVVYYIKIYAGYSNSNVAGFIKIGNKYSFTGVVQKRNGAYQVSGLTYVPLQSGGDLLTRTEKNAYYIFDTRVSYQTYYEKNALNSDVTITEAKIEGNILIIKGTAVPKTKDGVGEETTHIFNVDITDSILSNASSLVGKSFSATGINKGNGIIQILKYQDINFK